MTTKLQPGRFSRAALHTEAGEAEFRLSAAGNWQIRVRGSGAAHWQLACSGDLSGVVLPPEPSEAAIRVGPVTVDPATRTATVGDEQVRLSALEFDLLAMLATHPDRVFTKQELLRDVWGYRDGCRTRTLDSHASRVRCKLAAAGASGFIVSCRGVGYRLWNPVPLPAEAPQAA
jgi:DNA-binding response OmpR family regulator